MERWTRSLKRIVRVGLYLILLTPLLVWPGFLFPHLTAKVIAFQMVVELTIAGFVILSLVGASGRSPVQATDRSPATGRKRLLGIDSTAVWSVSGLYLLYSLVTAVPGVDVKRSLWGFLDRQDGLVLLIHFFAWFSVLVWFYRDAANVASPTSGTQAAKDPVRRSSKSTAFYSYLNFSYWVSFAVALTALVEWLCVNHWEYVPVLLQTPLPDRVSGVFGNPMALGPYLVFHFFYGIYYLSVAYRRDTIDNSRRGSHPKGKVARGPRPGLFPCLIAAELILLVVVFLGKTRGVIFSVLIGSLAVAALWLFRRPMTQRMKVLALGLMLLVAIGGISLWLLRNTAVVRDVQLLNRLTHISASENKSTRMRLLTWRSAASGFWEHPILGWGHNNVYYALNKYYDPSYIAFEPHFAESKATWYDKAHNAYIDLLVEKGIPGVLLFLALAVTVARTVSSINNRHLRICLAGGLVAYAFNNFVAFETFGSLFGLFLFLACASLAALPTPAIRDSHPAEARRREQKIKKRPVITLGLDRKLFIVVVLALLVSGIYLNIEIALANARSYEGENIFVQDPLRGVAIYKNAFSHFSPYRPREKLNYSYLFVNSLINKRPLPDGSIDEALRLAKEALSAHPRDVATYMILNDIYNGLGLYVDPGYLEQAEAFGKTALELSPMRQEAIFYLGRTYILRNEAHRAVELNERMVESYPDFPVARWFLGLSLIADNRPDRAKAEIKRAFQMGYRFRNDGERNVAKQLFGAKDFQELMQEN